MLDEIDDDTDLDEIAFNSQDEAFSWLKTAMNKGDAGDFSKCFKKNRANLDQQRGNPI